MNGKRWIGTGRGGLVTRLLAAVLLLAVWAAPAAAGEAGKKCDRPLQECLDYMAKKMRASGFVGVELDVDEETGAYTVQGVVPGSPAQSAGIRPGDLLYALDGVRIVKENREALEKLHKQWKPGHSVTYTIRRDGADREITLTLAPMPADVMARWIGMHMLEHAAEEPGPDR